MLLRILIIRPLVWGIFGIDDVALAIGGGAIIGAGGSLIGGALNSSSQTEVNQMQIDFNREEAQKNRDYQERLSNSAYQRATKDMEKANINPMLAYMKGGASSPTGSQAQVSLDAPEPGKGIAEGSQRMVSSAFQGMALKKELESKDVVMALDQASTGKQIADTALSTASAKETAERAKGLQLENEALSAGLGAKKAHGQINKDWATFDAGLSRLGEVLNTITNGVNIRKIIKGGGGENNPQNPARIQYENKMLKRQNDTYRKTNQNRRNQNIKSTPLG